jgi:hypothetical protein
LEEPALFSLTPWRFDLVKEVALMTMKEIRGAEMSASNSRSRRVRVYMSVATQEFAICPIR